MRTIETTVTVTPDGEIIVAAKANLPAGAHRAVLVIDTVTVDPSEVAATAVLDLRTFALDNWPADATFRREDLYSDDGRYS